MAHSQSLFCSPSCQVCAIRTNTPLSLIPTHAPRSTPSTRLQPAEHITFSSTCGRWTECHQGSLPPRGLSDTPATGQHSHAQDRAIPSTALSPVGSSNSSDSPRAASTGNTETETKHRQHATRLGLEPKISAASTPWASEHPGLCPASQNPVSTPQPARGTRATPRAPRPRPSEGRLPVLLLDHSSEEEVGAPGRGVLCPSHPCRHLQKPCAELQRRWRCRCPGLSGEDTLPEPPKLRAVAETTDTSVLVRWCAPNSVVRAYQIRSSPEGRPGNQSVVRDVCATARQHVLHGLSPATAYRVCVLAANGAGLSRRGARTAFSTRLLAAGLCCRARPPRVPRRHAQLLAFRNPALAAAPSPSSPAPRAREG